MRKIRYSILIVALLCMALSIIGCGKEKPVAQASTKDVVFKIGNQSVSYSELWIYANTIKEGYEKSYGTGIWDIAVEDNDEGSYTIEDVTRRDIIDTIIRTKILVSKASEYEVSLSGEEKDEVNKQAEAFIKNLTDDDIEECGASVELAMTVFEENAIASKVYAKILKGNTYEVSEEDARMTTIYDLVFETYNLDEDGKTIEYFDEEKEARLDEANEAFNKLATGENVVIEDIVSQYALKYAGEHTLSYDDMVTAYGEKACSVIYSLSDGECSQVIQTEYGYHIVKMIASTDSTATSSNRDALNKENEKRYFDELFVKWKKDKMGSFNYDKDVNMDVYSRIKF